MKLFKKTWFAVLLCVVAVVGTTLLNTRVKFGEKCAAVRASLYQADAKDVSIPTELKGVLSSMDGLIELAGERRLDTEQAAQSAEQLEALLDEGGADAGQLHAAYRQLLAESDSLIAQLGELSLNDHDSATLLRCITGINGTRSSIEDSGYNESVESFLDSYYHFPTKNLAALTGVLYPELFN